MFFLIIIIQTLQFNHSKKPLYNFLIRYFLKPNPAALSARKMTTRMRTVNWVNCMDASEMDCYSPLKKYPDNAIHRTNNYPADSAVCFVNTYPPDSELSVG